MVTRVNGGVINNQVLTGSLRYFLLNANGGEPGPFDDTISDGDKRVGFWRIVSGGSGYAAGLTDVGAGVNVVGGTSTTTATFLISQVENGEVTGVSLNNPGVYSVIPTNPITTTDGGAGSGLTLAIDWKSTLIIPGATGATPDGSEYYIAADEPVPGSAAEQALEIISQRATIVSVAVISGSTQEILVVCEDTGFGWETLDGSGVIDTDMQLAIRALGAALVVPDETDTGDTVDMTALTVTEKFFNDGIAP
jgi:hypothetical protein